MGDIDKGKEHFKNRGRHINIGSYNDDLLPPTAFDQVASVPVSGNLHLGPCGPRVCTEVQYVGGVQSSG